MYLVHIHVSAVNWTQSKVEGPCFVFTKPTPNKIQSWTPLKDISFTASFLVPSPYIFSNFIPLDMNTQFSDTNTFKNWPEVCQFEIITLGVVLSYSFIMFLVCFSIFWNLVLLQQITLIKKHKGNLPLLLVCTWRQRLYLLWLFSCEFFERKFYSTDPQNGRLVTWLQTKTYSSQLSTAIEYYRLWHSVIFELFWKNCSYVSGISVYITGLRLLRS